MAGRKRREYAWTAELRELLREVYRADSKRALTAGIDRLQRLRPDWPRYAWKVEARRLGLVTEHRRPWTRSEDQRLLRLLGSRSVKAIAREMGRSHESVSSRSNVLKLSTRIRSGMTVEEIQRCFGVSYPTVKKWISRGWLGELHKYDGVHGRVTDAALQQFVKEHWHEIDLRRVEQVWLWSLVFGETLCQE